MVVTNLDADILLPKIEALGITNPVKKLDILMRESYKVINRAIQEKKVHPYSHRVLGIKNTFTNLEKALVEFDSQILLKVLNNPYCILDKKISICSDSNQVIFTFKVGEDETSDVKRKIKEYTICLDKSYNELSKIEQEALNEIRLYDLKCQTVLKRGEILKRASIVVPENNIEGRVYNILEINLNGGANIVNETRAYSAEDINEHIDPLLLQTVAMARNSEKYPYEETSRNAVLDKYEALCMTRH